MDIRETLCGLSAEAAARRLLGGEITRIIDNQALVARIVEVEAYDQNDPASHSFRGLTNRNSVMFGPPGFAYVYFIYGLHTCLNITVGNDGFGSAVLIRALEPINGIEKMQELRPQAKEVYNLTNGPAKLTQALGISLELNGHDLDKPPLLCTINPVLTNQQIVQTTRIGITKATERPRRFYIKGSSFINN